MTTDFPSRPLPSPALGAGTPSTAGAWVSWQHGHLDGAQVAALLERLESAVREIVPDAHQVTAGVRAGEPSLVVEEWSRVARVDDEELVLTVLEFDLLAFLVQRPGHVFTRTRLLREVWRLDYSGGTRTVDVHVARLRRKLERLGRRLETVRGVGYRWRDDTDGLRLGPREVRAA